MFLCDARGDAIREQHHVQALLSRRVDGLIVVGDRPDPRPPLAGSIPVPVVYAYAPSESADDISLVSDNLSGGRLAIEHLLTCGRSRIAHVAGDPSYGASQDRATGALAALAEAGLEPVGGRIYFGAWTEAWGRGVTRMLLEQHPELDAVFAGSDQIARGVLDALHEAGKRVPEDVAVVGYDNWEVLACERPAPADQRRHQPRAPGPGRRPAALRGDRRRELARCREHRPAPRPAILDGRLVRALAGWAQLRPAIGDRQLAVQAP